MGKDQKKIDILGPSNNRPSEEMVHKKQNVKLVDMDKLVSVEKRVKDMRLIYTNADGLMSKKLELFSLIKEKPQRYCV